MKKLICLLLIAMLGACVKAGEFSPERHAQYEQGHPDCEKRRNAALIRFPGKALDYYPV